MKVLKTGLILLHSKYAFQDDRRTSSLEFDRIYYSLSQLNIQAPKMRKLCKNEL